MIETIKSRVGRRGEDEGEREEEEEKCWILSLDYAHFSRNHGVLT